MEKGVLMGPLIYLYILIGGRRLLELYMIPYTSFLRIHAYMDTNAYGDIYIIWRAYGDIPTGVSTDTGMGTPLRNTHTYLN